MQPTAPPTLLLYSKLVLSPIHTHSLLVSFCSCYVHGMMCNTSFLELLTTFMTMCNLSANKGLLLLHAHYPLSAVKASYGSSARYVSYALPVIYSLIVFLLCLLRFPTLNSGASRVRTCTRLSQRCLTVEDVPSTTLQQPLASISTGMAQARRNRQPGEDLSERKWKI